MRAAYRKNEPPSEQEKLSWLRLARTENVGPITFFNFIDYYGTADKALAAIPALAARGGRKKPLVIPAAGVIEREYEEIQRRGGTVITAAEAAYPLALAATEDAPPVITVFGDPALLARPCLGIVGARNASHNGRRFAQTIAADLGAAGQIIVSGLARGIDAAAHTGALPTGTVAVVAGGADVVYPEENRKLYDDICARGAIIAENPLGFTPRAQDFPRRNRIVSGLSQGVVVIEATLRSGSLITARLAGEQGRDVYAVPGHPLDPRAEGPNALIRDGAALIRSAQDILEDLGKFSGGALREPPPAAFTVAPPANDTPDDADFAAAREALLTALSFTPSEINQLIRATGIPTALAQTALMELELAGRLQRLSGNRAMLIE